MCAVICFGTSYRQPDPVWSFAFCISVFWLPDLLWWSHPRLRARLSIKARSDRTNLYTLWVDPTFSPSRWRWPLFLTTSRFTAFLHFHLLHYDLHYPACCCFFFSLLCAGGGCLHVDGQLCWTKVLNRLQPSSDCWSYPWSRVCWKTMLVSISSWIKHSNYVDQQTALAKNLTFVNDQTIIMRADSTTVISPQDQKGRDTVRIVSKKSYTTHVVV